MQCNAYFISEKLLGDIPESLLLTMYRTMLRIRKFEEKVAKLLLSNQVKCPTHLYIGQEAIAAGVCINLLKEDYAFATYRSHGVYIAKGGDLNKLMAELHGKETGCSRGKGGSMHVVSPEIGILGTTAIVSANIPLAIGTALASQLRRSNRVTAVFFGDGATDEGTFHESLNFASLKQLPIIFVCENNHFSTHLPLYLRQPDDNISEQAESHKIPSMRIDGNNVLEVFHASKLAIERVREGGGPSFIECETFRWRAHVGPWWDLDVGLRTKDEVKKWIQKCPIKSYEKLLLHRGILSKSQIRQIRAQVRGEVEASLVFAKQSPFPDASQLIADVFKT